MYAKKIKKRKKTDTKTPQSFYLKRPNTIRKL